MPRQPRARASIAGLSIVRRVTSAAGSGFEALLRRRRMVHRFEARQPPRELVDRVLEAALHAPSAGFSQGFLMTVIDDPERVPWFWQTAGTPREGGPPVIVVATVSRELYLERYRRPDKAAAAMQTAERWPVPFWWVDAGMAVMLVLLAAVENGLGGWFFGITQGIEDVLAGLGVPEGHEFVGVIGLGYAAADDRKEGSSVSIARRRFDEVVRRA
jgi:nitroreductase